MTRALLALLAGTATVALSACGGDGSTPPAPVVARPSDVTRPDRPATYESCGDVDVVLPARWQLVDRSLPNLGGGVHGRAYRWDTSTSRLELSVGVDVLELYEDLDFDVETIEVGSAHVQVSRAGAFGTSDHLIVLTWTQSDQVAPCSNYTLAGTNVDEAELVSIARKVVG